MIEIQSVPHEPPQHPGGIDETPDLCSDRFTLGLSAAHAQSQLLGQEKKLLEMTRSNWVSFRDFNGQQLIYFTHLEVYRCGISQVRYSLNTDRLDREWKLAKCDPKNPHAIPEGLFALSDPAPGHGADLSSSR